MLRHDDYVNVHFGHRAWSLFRDGTILRVISGGDGTAAAVADPAAGVTDPAAAAAPVAGDPNPAAPGKTFTQAEVDAIATREAASAERRALKTLTDTLGMTPDEAKTMLDEAKEKNLAAMTEAERKTAEAAERDTKAGEREAAAARREHEATLLVQLLGADVPAATAKDVAKLLDVEVGADEQTIADAITALKTRLPALFAPVTADAGTAPSGQAAGAGKPPAGGTANASSGGLDKGKERAARQNAQRGIPVPAGASQ